MSIDVLGGVLPHLQQQADHICETHPEHADEVRRLLHNFRETYGNRIFADIRELVNTLCPEVMSDRNLVPKPSAQDAIDVSMVRIRVARSVVHAERERLMASGGLPSGGSSWSHPTSGISFRPSLDVPLKEHLEQYIDLALSLGADALIQILISVGELTEEHRADALHIISRYLGECDYTGRTPGGPFHIPQAVLEFSSVRHALRHLSKRLIYQRLVADDIDSLEGYDERVAALPQTALRLLEGLWEEEVVHVTDAHTQLLQDVQEDFSAYAAWQLPDRMARTITIRDTVHPLPSLRQRIAIVDTLRSQHKYIAFAPGLGKTFIPLAVWETENERRLQQGKEAGRLLYVCPPNVLDELPFRITHAEHTRVSHEGYYRHDPPSVGIIRSGITSEDLESSLQADVIFTSIHMLRAERDERRIVDHIIASCRGKNGRPLTGLALDEAHMLNGDGVYSELIDDLVCNIPALHEEGHITPFSGTPVPNQIGDITAVLRKMDPPAAIRAAKSEDGGSRARHTTPDPDAFRNACLDRLLLLDGIQPWETHLREIPYRPSQPEQRFIDMLVEDSSLPMIDKMHLISLATLHPRLVSGNVRMPWGLKDALAQQLEQYLLDSDSVLIAENFYRQGILAEYRGSRNDTIAPLHEHIATICASLEKKSASAGDRRPIRFRIIHGDTRPALREQYLLEAKESAETGLSKTVIMAHSDCIKYGMNLSFFTRMIGMEHPLGCQYLEQLVHRCLREDNTNFEMALLVGLETLHEAYLIHAQEKERIARRFLRGHALSQQDMASFGRDQLDKSTYTIDGRTRFGTAIVQKLETKREAHDRIQGALHNRGLTFYDRKFQDSEMQLQWLDIFMPDRDKTLIPEHVRSVAGVLRHLRDEHIIQGPDVLDVHSTALGLERVFLHLRDHAWNVTSVVPQQGIGSEGMRLLIADGLETGKATYYKERMDLLTAFYSEQQSHVVVCSNGFEFTRPPRAHAQELPEEERIRHIRRNERFRTLRQFHRVLSDQGILILQLPAAACTDAEREQFGDALAAAGFTVLQQYSGKLSSVDNDGGDAFLSHLIVAQKDVLPSDRHERAEELYRRVQSLSPTSLRFSHEQDWNDKDRRKNREARRPKRLPYPFLHHQFGINGHTFSVPYKTNERLSQLSHIAYVREAVALLRDLQQKGEDLLELSPEEFAELRDLGVHHMPVSKQNDPTFYIDNPDKGIYQIIHPLDRIWDT